MAIRSQKKLMKLGTVDTEVLITKQKYKKATKQELGCKFITIDPDQEDFDIFKTINKILRHNKQSTKRYLTSKSSTAISGLDFKSDFEEARRYGIYC